MSKLQQIALSLAADLTSPCGFAQDDVSAIVDIKVTLSVDQRSVQAFWKDAKLPYTPRFPDETSVGYYVATRADKERKRLEGVMESCRLADTCALVVESR